MNKKIKEIIDYEEQELANLKNELYKTKNKWIRFSSDKEYIEFLESYIKSRGNILTQWHENYQR